MAWVQKRPQGYRVFWRTADGVIESKQKKDWTKLQAQRHGDAEEARHVRTPWATTRASQVKTFHEYATDLLESRNVTPKTRGKEERIRRIVEGHFGYRRLNEVSPADIRALVSVLTKTYSAAYVRDIYGITKMVFEHAVADGVIGQTPCVAIKLPKRSQTVKPVEYAAVVGIASSIDPRYRLLVLLLGATGARIGELLALRVDDIVLDGTLPAVNISKTVSEGENYQPIVKLPKTEAGIRTINLPQWIRRPLVEHIMLLPHRDWLFPGLDGQMLDPHHFRRRYWKPAAKAAGYPTARPHQFRHFHVSLLLEQGRPLTEVSRRAGHANTSVTAQVYAHWLHGDDSGAAEVIPNFAETESEAVSRSAL